MKSLSALKTSPQGKQNWFLARLKEEGSRAIFLSMQWPSHYTSRSKQALRCPPLRITARWRDPTNAGKVDRSNFIADDYRAFLRPDSSCMSPSSQTLLDRLWTVVLPTRMASYCLRRRRIGARIALGSNGAQNEGRAGKIFLQSAAAGWRRNRHGCQTAQRAYQPSATLGIW